jgi:hypothetical protein
MFYIICGSRNVDKCHIKSRGSGGSDEESNILIMCRRHHSEQHQIGWRKFCNKYEIVLLELEARGFYFDKDNKLRRDNGL